MGQESDDVPDVSAAYHVWDELVTASLRLALSTSGDDPQESSEAAERLRKAQGLALAERDAMWARIVARLEGSSRGR